MPPSARERVHGRSDRPVLEVRAVLGPPARPLHELHLAPAVDAAGHVPPGLDRVFQQVAGRDGGEQGEFLVPGQVLEVVKVVLGTTQPTAALTPFWDPGVAP